MAKIDETGRQTLKEYLGIDFFAHPELIDSVHVVELGGGEWLFHQGEPGDALYLLVRGRLQVWREHDDGRPAERIGEVSRGESVGEVGLLTGEARSASVRASRDSILLLVDQEAFELLASHYPSLMMKLTASVARRLHQATTSKSSAIDAPRTLALLPLEDSPRVRSYCDRLAADLCVASAGLEVRQERLAALGAPEVDSLEDGEPSAALKHWCSALEDEHERLIFLASAKDDAWTRFAMRQADLVVLVGDGPTDPDMRGWEATVTQWARRSVEVRHALVLCQPGGGVAISNTAAWLSARKVAFHLHVRDDRPDDHERVVRILSGRATGLVLGGGAARGFAHVGVYRAMIESGVPVDWVGGASMGGIMAAVVASDWGPEEATCRTREAFVEVNPFRDYTLPMVSILRGQKMVRLCQQYFPSDLEDLPIPCFCVSTDAGSGQLNVHEHGPAWAAVSASAALPGIMPPMVHRGSLAMDGGILNNLPVDIMQQKPVRWTVAVSVQRLGKPLRVDYPEVPSPWKLLRQQVLPSVFGRQPARVPGIATSILKSMELGSMTRRQALESMADLLLRPPVQEFSILKVTGFDRMVEIGYQHGLERLGPWIEAGRG